MRFILLATALILGGCVWFNQPDAYRTLSIIHTNDLHSHFLPSDAKYQDCEEGNEHCLGGYGRIKMFIEENRQDNTLVLDAGDRFSGTVFYTLRKSQDVTALTNVLNYDVVTLGNHEFDDGLNELEKFAVGLSAPIVSANVVFPKDSKLNKRIVPSVIVHKNGLKIGVIGALAEETKSESAKAQDINLTAVIPAVREEVERLKQQQIDILIALTHIGIDKDMALAKAVPDLDVIVGGHTHTLLSNNRYEKNVFGAYPMIVRHQNGSKTLIVTSGLAGHHVGLLNVKFDKNGYISSFNGDTIRMDDKIKNDLKITDMIADIEAKIQTVISEPILMTQIPIHMTGKERYCSENCYVGEVLTDTLLNATKEYHTDIAFLNAGGIRAALPKGQVAFRHIASAYPFDSNATIIQMTGAELVAYISHGIQKYLPNDRTNAFLQIAGGTYEFSPDTKKADNVRVSGNPVDENKIYRVIVPSFMAEGGDGFKVFENKHTLPISIRDMMINYLKSNPHIKPFENRIRKK